MLSTYSLLLLTDVSVCSASLERQPKIKELEGVLSLWDTRDPLDSLASPDKSLGKLAEDKRTESKLVQFYGK